MDSVNNVQMIEWHISFKNQIIHEYVVCDLRSRLIGRVLIQISLMRFLLYRIRSKRKEAYMVLLKSH